jgi:SNF2 family DNA or RNA helicase
MSVNFISEVGGNKFKKSGSDSLKKRRRKLEDLARRVRLEEPLIRRPLEEVALFSQRSAAIRARRHIGDIASFETDYTHRSKRRRMENQSDESDDSSKSVFSDDELPCLSRRRKCSEKTERAVTAVSEYEEKNALHNDQYSSDEEPLKVKKKHKRRFVIESDSESESDRIDFSSEGNKGVVREFTGIKPGVTDEELLCEGEGRKSPLFVANDDNAFVHEGPPSPIHSQYKSDSSGTEDSDSDDSDDSITYNKGGFRSTGGVGLPSTFHYYTRPLYSDGESEESSNESESDASSLGETDLPSIHHTPDEVSFFSSEEAVDDDENLMDCDSEESVGTRVIDLTGDSSESESDSSISLNDIGLINNTATPSSSSSFEHVSVHRKYWEQDVSDSVGMKSIHSKEPWLVAPYLRIEPEACNNNFYSEIQIDSPEFQGRLLTVNCSQVNDLNLRRTFVIAGRGEDARRPIETHGGMVIMVVPRAEEQLAKGWVDLFTSVLVIDDLKVPLCEAENKGLCTVRRLAVFSTVFKFGWNDFVMMDDNTDKMFLSQSLQGLAESGWSTMYHLMRQSSIEQGFACAGMQTYRYLEHKEPNASQLSIDDGGYAYKVFFLNAKAIRNKGITTSNFQPVNAKLWGNDYFFQLILREYGLKVGRFSEKAMLMTRSYQQISLCKSMIHPANEWLRQYTGRSGIGVFPSEVQSVYKKMEDSIREQEASLPQEVQVSGAGLEDMDISTAASSSSLRRVHPCWRVSLGLQKRYVRQEANAEVLVQRWFILPFVRILQNNKEVLMMPAEYTYNTELLDKTFSLGFSYKKMLRRQGLKEEVMRQLDSLVENLPIDKKSAEATSTSWFLPSKNLETFLAAFNQIEKSGYEIFTMKEQEYFFVGGRSIYGSKVRVDKSSTVKSVKNKNKLPSLDVDDTPITRKDRDRSKIQQDLARAFCSSLKQINKHFDSYQKALLMRDHRPDMDWEEVNASRLTEVDVADKEAIGIYEQLKELFLREGLSENYKKAVINILPQGFKGVLMPYQVYGYLWSKNRLMREMGVIISDDMGLGKTIQTCALIEEIVQEQDKAPILVLCPKSVLGHWKQQLEQWCPATKGHIVEYTGSRKNRHSRKITEGTIVITTYETFLRDSGIITNTWLRKKFGFLEKKKSNLLELLDILYTDLKWIDKDRFVIQKPEKEDLEGIDFSCFKLSEEIEEKVREKEEKLKNDLFEVFSKMYQHKQVCSLARIEKWNGIVLDEAHAIRAAGSAKADLLLDVKARHRIALTGTPVQNSMSDLYTLCNFANPGFFLKQSIIEANFIRPIQDVIQEVGRVVQRNEGDIIDFPDQFFLKQPTVIDAYAAMRSLRSQLSHVLLRRLKSEEEVLQQITKFRGESGVHLHKVYEDVPYELTIEQKLLIKYIYDEGKTGLIQEVNRTFGLFQAGPGNIVGSSVKVTGRLMQLQQICSSPNLLSHDAVKHYLDVLPTDNVQNREQESLKQRLKEIFQNMRDKQVFGSGKIDACVDLVDGLMGEDPSNRVLIFVWLTGSGKKLGEALAEKGYKSHFINGQVNKGRQKIVDQFNGIISKKDITSAVRGKADAVWAALLEQKVIDDSGKLTVFKPEDVTFVWLDETERNQILDVINCSLKPVILLNIKAAGEGINLQAGNIHIDYERWWNPASMDQAAGRCYRIGQTRTVRHYQLVSRQVYLDELMTKKLNNKRLFQDFVLAGGDITRLFLQLKNMVIEELKQNGYTLIDISEEELRETLQKRVVSSSEPEESESEKSGGDDDKMDITDTHHTYMSASISQQPAPQPMDYRFLDDDYPQAGTDFGLVSSPLENGFDMGQFLQEEIFGSQEGSVMQYPEVQADRFSVLNNHRNDMFHNPDNW